MINIATLINAWITASNAFDTEKYLSFYLPDAVLDDPSVGKIFKHHQGIRQYFESYFVGYNTQTELINLDIVNDSQVHIEVKFLGNFSEGTIGGLFDLTFKEGKIAFVKADLVH